MACHHLIGVFGVSLLFSNLVFAQGGPPLVTDDPGTPGNGNWEINSALLWTPNDQSSTLQLPLFDINYGLGDHIQLNLNTSLINTKRNGSSSKSGISVASVATKWRFIDEESTGMAVSIYPRADFHHQLSSDDPSVNPPGSRYFFPIEFSKQVGQVGVNPEIGYATYTQSASEWVYGIAISYTFEQEKEVLFEVHGRSPVGSGDSEWLFNVGTRYLLANYVSFIGSMGQTFIAYDGQPKSWSVYAGCQFRL